MIQKHVLLNIPHTKFVVEPAPVIQSSHSSRPTCREDIEEPLIEEVSPWAVVDSDDDDEDVVVLDPYRKP